MQVAGEYDDANRLKLKLHDVQFGVFLDLAQEHPAGVDAQEVRKAADKMRQVQGVFQWG